ncbi:hypothetical protein THAOC_28271, partial [Thalassiosira oceanica]
FCHGCVLREQQRVAEDNNGRVPKWLKCMACREKTSFRPDEPKYHRLLIDLLGRAQQYASYQLKQEGQGDAISHASSDADDDERTSPETSKVDEQCSLKLEGDSPALDDESSYQHAVKHEELPAEKLHVRVKVEEPEDIIDEQFAESNRENEATADDCETDHAPEDEETNASSLVNEQKNIIHLIELLQYRVRHSKVPQVFETIDEISRQKELITPSIIVEFPLGDAIRSARKKFGDEYPEMKMKCKALSSEIRRIYEKEAENGVRNGKRTNEQAEHYEHSKLPRLALADDVHAGCFHTESTVDGYVAEAHSGDFRTELIEKEQDAREEDSIMPCKVDEVDKIPRWPDEVLSGGFHEESIEKKQDTRDEDSDMSCEADEDEEFSDVVPRSGGEVEPGGGEAPARAEQAQQQQSINCLPPVTDAPWYYADPQGDIQGPYRGGEMRQWLEAGYFKGDQPISQSPGGPFRALSGYFPNTGSAFQVREGPNAPDGVRAEGKDPFEHKTNELRRALQEAEMVGDSAERKERKRKNSLDSVDEEEDSKEAKGTSNGESKKRRADRPLESGESKKQALDSESNCKVYVRGLPWRATEDEIKEYFAECGEIKNVDMPLQDDGRSSGTGEFTAREAAVLIAFFFQTKPFAPILSRQAIIEFSDPSGSASALRHNGADFGGRWLNIKYSTSRPITEARAPSQKEEGCVTVFVGNMSFHIDEDTVRETFKDCGEIASIRFAEDKETGVFKGYGHVEFVESKATDRAVALAGTYVMNRPIRVDFANERKGRSSSGGGGGRGRRGGGRGGGGRGGRGYMSGGGGRGGRREGGGCGLGRGFSSAKKMEALSNSKATK